MNTPKIAHLAFAGLLAAGLVATSGGVLAADKDKDKCFGISKAGQNDCGGKHAKHSCAGQAKVDMDKNDWKYVDKGSCEKMGGSLKAAAEMEMKSEMKKDMKKDMQKY